MNKKFILLAIAASLLASNIASANATSLTPSKPKRIISLSPTATEDLFAIGAGQSVIAVDDQSNYPRNAPKSNLSGYLPNIEAILAKRPDLVVVSYDTNNLVSGLRAANVRVLMQPAAENLDEVYSQITQLGTITGHSANATKLVAEMKKNIAKAISTIPSRRKGLSFYHELDDTYYSVTSDTFIGSLYKLAGWRNIADAAPDASYGYPQLSSEFILQANPDFIFLADSKCCGVNTVSLRTRPGFRNLNAVKYKHVIILNDDIASRWGPRTVDLFYRIVGAIPATK